MVKVGCRLVNGLRIRLQKKGWDDGTGDGVAPMVWDGPAVVLSGTNALHSGVGNPTAAGHPVGVTEVDAEWMAAWMKQNAQNPLVTSGDVFLIEEAPVPNAA